MAHGWGMGCGITTGKQAILQALFMARQEHDTTPNQKLMISFYIKRYVQRLRSSNVLHLENHPPG